MPSITFIEFSGEEHVLEAEDGQSLMQLAVDNMVPGIGGECGGACSCATCHGYIDESQLALLPAKLKDEVYMLEGALEVRENSRLCCQIKFREALDGLKVSLPESQY